MTASTVKSENITNIEAVPQTILDKRSGVLQTIFDIDAIATTSVDEIGDIMLFGPIESNCKILDVLILSDDLDSDSALRVDVGLYYSGIGGNQAFNGNTSGEVIDAACFASAHTTLSAAATTWTSVRFEADDIIDVNKEAWEVAGLTSDPGGLFYIGLTVTTAGTSADAGDVVVRVDFINN